MKHVVIVITVFLILSAVSFAIGFDSNNVHSQVLPDVSQQNTGYVQSTLILLNNSLINGNFNSTNSLDPAGVVADPLNGFVYVTDTGGDSVSIINGSTNQIIGLIPVGNYPLQIAFDSSNGYIYVTNANSHTVSVINATESKVIKCIPYFAG